jgi:hypothetical protein
MGDEIIIEKMRLTNKAPWVRNGKIRMFFFENDSVEMISPRWGFGIHSRIVFYYDGALTELKQNECANPYWYEILYESFSIMMALL